MGGNQNNFGSEAQCRQTCMMQNDAQNVEEEEEEEEEEGETDSNESIIMSREAICKKSRSGMLGSTWYKSKLTCSELGKPPNNTHTIDYLDLTSLKDGSIENLALFLAKFPNLKVLILDDNDFIRDLPAGIFNSMKKLKVVSLKKLQISQLPNQLFSMNPILKCLLLRNSGITELDLNIFSSNVTKKLKEVDLTGSNVSKNLRKHWKGKKRIAQFFKLAKNQ